MNLRISDSELRFRVTRGEFAALLQGDALQLALPHSTAPYCYLVQAEESGIPLLLSEERDQMTLTVDRNALKALAEQQPSRDGIAHKARLGGKEWLLLFEVDVRRMPKR